MLPLMKKSTRSEGALWWPVLNPGAIWRSLTLTPVPAMRWRMSAGSGLQADLQGAPILERTHKARSGAQGTHSRERPPFCTQMDVLPQVLELDGHDFLKYGSACEETVIVSSLQAAPLIRSLHSALEPSQPL